MRHVRVGQLWIQGEEETEELKVRAEEDFERTDSNDELQVSQWESRTLVEAAMSDH